MVMKIITIEKNAIEQTLELLDIENPICSSCKIPITKHNFGGIFHAKLTCNNLFCMNETIGDN